MIGGHPKILIIRLSAIGDVVRVLPAATAIRDAYPKAQIDWVVEPSAADLLIGNAILDRVYVFKRRPQLLRSALYFVRLSRRLREQQYDIALDFHGIFKSGLLLGATRAARRIAFAPPRAREGSHRFANELTALPDTIINRVEENRVLACAIYADEALEQSTVFIEKQINEDVFRYITERRSGRPWLVLVHAPVERSEKRWPAERFAALVDLLIEDGRFDVVLTYGPGQQQMLTPILLHCRHEPIVPPACNTLREFAGLSAMASLFVGLDSGPMHIAAAVGTPVVAIFGGTDPRMHAPIGSPSRVLGGVPVQARTDRASMEESMRTLNNVDSSSVFQACVDLLDSVS